MGFFTVKKCQGRTRERGLFDLRMRVSWLDRAQGTRSARRGKTLTAEHGDLTGGRQAERWTQYETPRDGSGD